MQSDTLLLIDFSQLARMAWEVRGKEPDPDWTSQQIVTRVRALASDFPHAAICCDAGRSFRYDIDPAYKATRPDRDALAPLYHQMALAMDVLRADGFPVWTAPGFEADDIIATATKQALACDGDVLIASSDKDLLQLVGPHVSAKSLTNGNVLDEQGVLTKFGVMAEQMGDYLALVGDSSDNIKGAEKIGAVNAQKLLKQHGTLNRAYAALDAEPGTFSPAILASLMEFRARLPIVRQLLTLRTDVEIPFAECAAERKAATTTVTDMETGEAIDVDVSHELPAPEAIRAMEREHRQQIPQQGAAPRTDLLPAPAEWDRALEPRSYQDARMLATDMFAARLFSAYGTKEGILATVLAGRELGLPAMASLRGFHIIEGKPCQSADLIAALVLRSSSCRYFRCTERTPERATFVTKRGDDPELALSYSIAEAKAAWKKDQKAWDASGWGRNTSDMLVARAKSKLARLVYPDVVGGLYSPEELDQ